MENVVEYEDEDFTLSRAGNVLLVHTHGDYRVEHVEATKRLLRTMAKEHPGKVVAMGFVDAHTPASSREVRQAAGTMFRGVEQDIVAFGLYMDAEGLVATMVRSAVTFVMSVMPSPVNVRLCKTEREAREFVRSAMQARGVREPRPGEIDTLWRTAFGGLSQKGGMQAAG